MKFEGSKINHDNHVLNVVAQVEKLSVCDNFIVWSLVNSFDRKRQLLSSHVCYEPLLVDTWKLFSPGLAPDKNLSARHDKPADLHTV